MKTLGQTFLAILFTLGFSFTALSQTARVQVIHNSADAAAETVDIWLNESILLDDFSFRTSSPFIDAPAEEEITISVAPANSTSTDDAIAQFNYNLEEDEKYILLANGIVSEDGYDPATPFNIYVYDMARETATDGANTDALVFHGSTDAPTVDVVEVGAGAGTIVDNAAYGDFAGYLELPTADYSLQVRDESGTTTVAQFAAPLSTLELDGAALTIVASGFLNPDNNSGGEAFGLYVALPSGGELVELPAESISTARVQVIHNSADAAAETVDIWLNDGLLLDDFSFRSASPFIDAPAGEEFTISVAPSNSTSADDAIAQFDYTLEGGEKYILVASGIVSENGYDPAEAFDIYVYNMAREMASDEANTDVLVFHGSTDAPTVDVVEVGAGAGTIVDNAAYGDFAGYLELPTADYSLQVRDESGTTTVAQFAAPLSTLELDGAALTLVAGGFLNPDNNSGGEAFGLYAAPSSGGELVELPAESISTARVQVIHNSADAAAETVDIWLNDTPLLDDFSFRTASPFVDAPAGEEFTISVAPANSTSADEAIAQFDYTLEGGEKYILVASGIVSESGYDPAEAFDIYVYNMAREMTTDGANTDALVFHGSTDAPTVDVVEVGAGAGTIVDNAAYGDFAGYLELPTADYSLQVRDESGTTTVAQFAAPLSTLELDGSALTIVASGFLNPDNNNGGEAFGLYVALPSGGELVELPAESISTARVQVIHNSADAAAETVDIWLNDTPLLDDFSFRTASPFVDAPAGEEFTISVAPANSTSADDAIAQFDYTLEGGEKYILLASGIVSESGYTPAEAFDIYVYDMAREMATDNANTDALVFHGSTDAPTVDILETGVGAGTLVDNASYGDFAGYLELPTADYQITIADETGESAVAVFGAPLSSLGLDGQALTIVASGFLSPADNNNGAAFGLYVALPSGGELVELQNTTSVEENEMSIKAWSIYPNPASQRATIELTEEMENAQLRVMSLTGQVLDVMNIENQRKVNLSTERYSEGIYFINITNGSAVQTKKLQIVK